MIRETPQRRRYHVYLFNYSSNLLYWTQRTTTEPASTDSHWEVRPSVLDKAARSGNVFTSTVPWTA